MRISTLIARAENQALRAAGWVGRKAFDVRARARCALEDARLDALAASQATIDALPRLDQAEVLLRAEDLQRIRDAATVRRNERALRRLLARKIRNGEIALEALPVALAPDAEPRP